MDLLVFLRDDVAHTSDLGWAALTNGDLLTAAEMGGFAVMVTCDQNIIQQQNLTIRRLALVVLSTTHWETIRRNGAAIRAAVDAQLPSGYAHLNFERPPFRRPKPKRDI